jgi:hypothetical protein
MPRRRAVSEAKAEQEKVLTVLASLRGDVSLRSPESNLA